MKVTVYFFSAMENAFVLYSIEGYGGKKYM
jgi:hypothetical protein